MAQLWLPAVPPEVPPACPERTRQPASAREGTQDREPPARVVAASAPAAGAVCEAPGGAGAAGTQGARASGRVTAHSADVQPCAPAELAAAAGTRAARCQHHTGIRRPAPSPAELAELDALIARLEWAADGGDGSVCSTTELEDVPALNLEWILHGALLEAMAAVLMDVHAARPFRLEQSENSRGAAA
jgi:hypothetical protein